MHYANLPKLLHHAVELANEGITCDLDAVRRARAVRKRRQQYLTISSANINNAPPGTWQVREQRTQRVVCQCAVESIPVMLVE